MSLSAMLTGLSRRAETVWSQIWFEPMPTAPLEIVRIGVGGLVFLHYAMASPYLFMLWGNTDWMPIDAAQSYIDLPWENSLQFYFSEPWHWIAFHALFLFCLGAFTVGWRTSFVKWIVLIAHISYCNRNLSICYGVNSITGSLLLLMCLAPVGRAMSLDRVRAVRAVKRRDPAATIPVYESPWTCACTRLVQIQMVTMLLFSGISKIRGDDWWNTGDAVWQAVTTYEFHNPTFVAIAAHNYWIINVSCYGTIFLELIYPFLVWQRATRPLMLACAVFLHVMFFFVLHLVYFSLIMIFGHLSFVRPEWLARAREAWSRRMGDMELVYDGQCTSCVRAIAWFLAFDGLGQVKVRNGRSDQSPIISSVYTTVHDGRVFKGFDAFRYIVLRVPGLWWMVPLFYTPVVSRLLGQPIYHWVMRPGSEPSGLLKTKPADLDSAARV